MPFLSHHSDFISVTIIPNEVNIKTTERPIGIKIDMDILVLLTME